MFACFVFVMRDDFGITEQRIQFCLCDRLSVPTTIGLRNKVHLIHCPDVVSGFMSSISLIALSFASERIVDLIVFPDSADFASHTLYQPVIGYVRPPRSYS